MIEIFEDGTGRVSTSGSQNQNKNRWEIIDEIRLSYRTHYESIAQMTSEMAAIVALAFA